MVSNGGEDEGGEATDGGGLDDDRLVVNGGLKGEVGVSGGDGSGRGTVDQGNEVCSYFYMGQIAPDILCSLCISKR